MYSVRVLRRRNICTWNSEAEEGNTASTSTSPPTADTNTSGDSLFVTCCENNSTEVPTPTTSRSRKVKTNNKVEKLQVTPPLFPAIASTTANLFASPTNPFQIPHVRKLLLVLFCVFICKCFTLFFC